jgi:hypothetical protein
MLAKQMAFFGDALAGLAANSVGATGVAPKKNAWALP